jgi:hypothetical protein
MGTSPFFEKVGECLYRNPSSGTYYALVKIRGKQIKRSLDTDNLPEARRKLRDFKNERARIDQEVGRLTVDALCDRGLESGVSQGSQSDPPAQEKAWVANKRQPSGRFDSSRTPRF